MQRTNEAKLLSEVEIPLDPITETPARLGSRSENLAEVAHDASNMVTALACYCDLLEEPGVLSEPYRHYGSELKLVAAASRRLIDKLLTIDCSGNSDGGAIDDKAQETKGPSLVEPAAKLFKAARAHGTPSPRLVDDLVWELQRNRNLLAALAGPSIALTVDIASGALPIQMTCEDLTRILVNLVKNAVEAMPTGGAIRLSLREIPAGPDENASAILTVEDNGPGIPSTALGMIFDPGYTTRPVETNAYGVCCPEHHGLGLAITRSIVESAGGRIQAANRDPVGACFQIELPARCA